MLYLLKHLLYHAGSFHFKLINSTYSMYCVGNKFVFLSLTIDIDIAGMLHFKPEPREGSVKLNL